MERIILSSEFFCPCERSAVRFLRSQGQFQLIHFVNKGKTENLALCCFMPKEHPCLVETDGNDLPMMFSSLIFMLELCFVRFYDARDGKVIFKQFKSILKVT